MKKKGINSGRITTYITIGILIIIGGLLTLTGWFVVQALQTTEQSSQVSATDVSVGRLNVDKLDRIEKNLNDKQNLPLPDSSMLRNPFVTETPASPPAGITAPPAPPAPPAPTVETPPASSGTSTQPPTPPSTPTLQ